MRTRIAYFKGAIEQMLKRSTSLLDAAGVPQPIDRGLLEGVAGEMAAGLFSRFPSG